MFFEYEERITAKGGLDETGSRTMCTYITTLLNKENPLYDNEETFSMCTQITLKTQATRRRLKKNFFSLALGDGTEGSHYSLSQKFPSATPDHIHRVNVHLFH